MARAAVLLSVMFLLSRLLGFVRQAVINGQIGLGPEADAWFAAFRIPDTLFTLFAGGALISAFIPVFAGLGGDDRAEDRRRLFSGVLNLLGMVMIGGSLLAGLFAPVLMAVMVPGFDSETRELATEATRYLMLSPLLLGISAVFKGALHAERDFLLPAVGPLLYNAGVIAGALLLVEPLGIIGLAWGTIAGALLHLLIQIPGLRRAGLGWRPAVALTGPGRRVIELMLPRLGGFAVIQLSFFFINYLASLQGPSGVAAFANAWMLLLFPLGILAIPYAEAVLPEFSDLSARGDKEGLARATSDSLSYVLFATLPAGLVMIVTGEPLVRVLFERGAFDATASAATAVVLAALAVGLVGHAAAEILTRVYYSRQDTRRPVLVISASLLLHMALSWALSGPFAVAGIALGVSIGILVEVVILYLWLRRLGLDVSLGAGTLRVFGASLLAAALAWLGTELLGSVGPTPPYYAAGVLLILALAVAAYLGATLAMGLEQPRILLRMLRSRLGPDLAAG